MTTACKANNRDRAEIVGPCIQNQKTLERNKLLEKARSLFEKPLEAVLPGTEDPRPQAVRGMRGTLWVSHSASELGRAGAGDGQPSNIPRDEAKQRLSHGIAYRTRFQEGGSEGALHSQEEEEASNDSHDFVGELQC